MTQGSYLTNLTLEMTQMRPSIVHLRAFDIAAVTKYRTEMSVACVPVVKTSMHTRGQGFTFPGLLMPETNEKLRDV